MLGEIQSLKRNVKNPKRFWCIINDMTKNENKVNKGNVEFVNQDNGNKRYDVLIIF